MRKAALAALLAAAFIVASAMASQAIPLRAESAPDTVKAASEFTQA
jgi:hypothetical protein